MFSSKGCRYLKKGLLFPYHNRSLSLSFYLSLGATCYGSSHGQPFYFKSNFADIIYKLVMPRKLLNKEFTGITHI